VAAVIGQEGLEANDGLFTLAGGGKDHRLGLGIQIDEHGDVVVASLGGGLVEAERLEASEIEPGHGLSDIVIDDAPQPLIGDLHDPRRGQHRHFAHQRDRRLFEQQGEAAALACPGHLDPLDAVLGASRARHPGGDGAVVLEEVQVAPGEPGEVMGLARPAAVRAGKQRPALGRHFQV
jgi:hypothetical protein